MTGEGIAAALKPQGQSHHQGERAANSQGDTWWWWCPPKAGAACEDWAALLCFFREQTIMAKIWFHGVRCSDVTPEHCIPLLSFFPCLEIRGKRHLIPALYRSPQVTGVPQGHQDSRHLPVGPAQMLVHLLWPSQHRWGTVLLKTPEQSLAAQMQPSPCPQGSRPHSLPVLPSGRSGRRDLMCCLVIQPAEDVQCHKLIIWLHAVHIGVTMWKS